MIPSNGSTLNAAVWLVMSQSGDFFALTPPTTTVSVPERRWSVYCELLVTGSVFTPVANWSTFVCPPLTNVELLLVSKRCCVEHPDVHAVPGRPSVRPCPTPGRRGERTRELERVAPGVEHDGDGLRGRADADVPVPLQVLAARVVVGERDGGRALAARRAARGRSGGAAARDEVDRVVLRGGDGGCEGAEGEAEREAGHGVVRGAARYIARRALIPRDWGGRESRRDGRRARRSHGTLLPLHGAPEKEAVMPDMHAQIAHGSASQKTLAVSPRRRSRGLDCVHGVEHLQKPRGAARAQDAAGGLSETSDAIT
jgi:hypothetical protein